MTHQLFVKMVELGYTGIGRYKQIGRYQTTTPAVKLNVLLKINIADFVISLAYNINKTNTEKLTNTHLTVITSREKVVLGYSSYYPNR